MTFLRARPRSGALAAVALASALSAALTVVPASASVPDGDAGVDYTCASTALLGLVPAGRVPLHLEALHQVTVPLGTKVSALTIGTGLAPLVAGLTGDVLSPLSTVSDLSFGIAEELSVAGSLDDSGAFDLPAFALPAGATAGSTLPITAPSSFTLQVAGGVLGSLACTIDDVGADVLGTILVGPASTDTTVTPVHPPIVRTQDGAGGATTTAASRPKLRAWLARAVVHRGRRARVHVQAATAAGTPATGRVVVRGAGRRLGVGRLEHGRAVVRLASLPVGRYRLKVRGAAMTRRLILRIVR
ncbi:hypothetical protein P5P86_16410 [Nocardioides sp. BP30]|uniref:hypothetical protein n=1 Tax=Nocardioides sp. BP30 TaxID=3036374 RepID=UPI002468D806|nr:hypothetical protein [Nocardioides sp. BP30]WGL51537.1 hypothetical protein P5P86_16410 [Nocardioides sp. BP30]